VNEIRRIFTPRVAAVMIALIVACQVVAVVGFAGIYMERGRTIEVLEDALCRERLARIAATLRVRGECRQAEKVLASSIPQIWTPPVPGRHRINYSGEGSPWSATTWSSSEAEQRGSTR